MSDAIEMEAAFAAAEVHPLLCAVAHRTGDLSLLREEFVPDQGQLLVPGRGLGPEQEEAARRLAGPPPAVPRWRRARPTTCSGSRSGGGSSTSWSVRARPSSGRLS